MAERGLSQAARPVGADATTNTSVESASDGQTLASFGNSGEMHMSTMTMKERTASTITVKDGTTIYYKDWGKGPVVTFSHGWPLSSDAWDGQMLVLAQRGFRVVGHDRRGHGRPSQPSDGNDMDGFADDLAAVIETLDLKDITMVGHST